MTVPATNVLHFRQGRRAISKDAYPDLDAFFDDVGDAYRKALRAFYDAGCRYLQLDDTTWSMMWDVLASITLGSWYFRSSRSAAMP